jgi:hypothetical protein
MTDIACFSASCYPHSQRDFHAQTNFMRDAAGTSSNELVAFARPLHLPAPPSACVADSHAT